MIINIFLIFGGCTLKTTSTTTVKKTQSFQKNPCDYSSYSEAIIPNSVYSLNKFLRSCTNNTDAYHKLVTKRLANLKIKELVIKKKSAKPAVAPKQAGYCAYIFFDEASKINTIESYNNFFKKCKDKSHSWYISAKWRLEELQNREKLSLTKQTIVKKPAVSASQAERPETIIVPVSSMGDVSDIRKQILQNTLTDELKKYFRIVPQEKYEQVLEQVFEELEYEECSEDTCIMRVQEMLQVENVFNLQIIGEGKDSQLNLKWITLDEKKNETDVCLGCGTFQLNDKVRGLIQKLVGGN